MTDIAHVLELRHFAAADGRRRTELLERDSTRIRHLEGCGLLVWDGGAQAVSGKWVSVRHGAVVVTLAGHAALRFYDLGLQRKGADAMAAAMSRSK